MNDTSKRRVLLVDDEPGIRECMEVVLTNAGYDVCTAAHGFDGLLQLRTVTPDVIISDLNMPQMSGFEFLSVVRRRFPEIPLIAASGAYDYSDQVPGGLIADAFFAKGRRLLGDLLLIVDSLIKPTAKRTVAGHRQPPPIRIPRNGKDSSGVPFVVLTCPECLRSFPLSVFNEDVQDIQETPCLFCSNQVRYVVDFTLPIASPRSDITVESLFGPSRAPQA